ncbi:MAG: sulfatase [Planctomycetes bacterium]|nr:sulfatase [Planctomycetota bacterium]
MPDRRTRREVLRSRAGSALAALFALAGAALAAGEASRRPNVVFILADDLGWRDTSLYGSPFHETPNIDRLAKRGMMFTNAYAANPLCSPTRASIMTGLWPARIGITAPACHLQQEKLEASVRARGGPDQRVIPCESATRLKTDYYTLAEALHDAGYRTGHFGKWHLGREPYDPLHQGFDVDIPHWPGPGPAGGYLAPWRFSAYPEGSPGEHVEDRMAKEAVKFIEQSKDRPFYLNYWHFSVHAPYVFDGKLQAKADLIAKYRKKAQTLDPASPQRNPVYAAMVETLDAAVGSIIDAIDRLGLAERTIIFFFSDNGGVHFTDIEGIPVTSNAPLRGGKATIYEGGTREDCIVVWPGIVRPGAKSDTVIQSIDFYPTILEMIGVAPKPGLAFDGMSFVPTLRGAGSAPRDAIFCFFPHATPATGAIPSVYVRRGGWKLIRFFHDEPGFAHRHELYNLKDDIGETRDLAAGMPEKVKELDALIATFLKDTRAVLPKPNPAYRPGLAGWQPSAAAEVSVEDGLLIVESTGGDPYVSTRAVPRTTGEVIVEFRMRSTASGPAQVFWAGAADRPLFAAVRSIRLEVAHDGAWHEYARKLPVRGILAALRIDPAAARGRIEFDWIRVKDTGGAILKEWGFEAAQRP